MDASGQTLREYIWLEDMPVAVVDNVDTTPVIYYVQTDHLMRPARMTDQDGNWVWDVIYAPFGAMAYVNQNPAVMDIRFPGQWFQLETGLAYNWHRHYDATTGRYVQPDPLLDDDGQISIRGISTNASEGTAPNGDSFADAMGWVTSDALMQNDYSPRVMLPDRPSLYGYARQSPLTRSDPTGLQAALAACIAGPNPVCDIGLIQTIITGATVAAGICEMARNETGQKNYIYYEAKMHPDPCAWLEAEQNKAKAAGDTQRVKDIIQAQKAAGCRNKQKRK